MDIYSKRILAHSLHPDTKLDLLTEVKTKKFQLTNHFHQKQAKWGIPNSHIITAKATGDLIEYHTLAGSRRVLLRDDRGICLVLDLDKFKAITVYLNSVSDNHATLKTSEYVGGGLPGLNIKLSPAH